MSNPHNQRDEARKVADKLTARFGPGMSNGVAAILLHENLPEHFNLECWKEWFFKPTEGAFVWAHDEGLIVPWKLSGKWSFTPLGLEVRNLLLEGNSHGEVKHTPAFPNGSFQNGMMLRDWFAGQALGGIISGLGNSTLTKRAALVSAAEAYMLADAMLEERSKAEGRQS